MDLMTEVLDADEYETWHDSGCELHPHCLSCPEPQCVLDLPGGKGTRKKDLREKKIRTLFSQGTDTRQLARLFSISIRTVQRALEQV